MCHGCAQCALRVCHKSFPSQSTRAMVPCFSLASLYLPPEPALSLSTGYSVSSLEAISGFMLSCFGVTSQLVSCSSLPASLCISQEEKLSSKESHLSSWPWRQAAYSETCPLCQRMTCGTVYMERGQRCDKVARVSLNRHRERGLSEEVALC